MSLFGNLEPAIKEDVIVYTPYYQKDRQVFLPYALSLYQRGNLEGKRYIEGGDDVPYVITWYVSKLPSELTRCRIQFEGQADFSYEATLMNSEFVDYLIDVMKISKDMEIVDFPQKFYRKLLKFEE
jgi:hypothetical protein